MNVTPTFGAATRLMGQIRVIGQSQSNERQVLIPQYLTRNCRGINILRGNVQGIQNMGLAARLKYNGINILRARY
jgi:hypothetical protein